MDIKPIETQYKGYRFRSRLEARWAVFFDALGVEWLYEPEGFVLHNGARYLPDFYLPQWKTWIEVKPSLPSSDEVFKFWQIAAANKNSDKPNVWQEHIMICGTPGYPQVNVRLVGGDKGPFADPGSSYFALTVAGNSFADGKPTVSFSCFADVAGGKTLDVWPIYMTPEEEGFIQLTDKIEPPAWIRQSGSIYGLTLYHGLIRRMYAGPGVNYKSARLMIAYTAARSARFEHGESPKVKT